MTLALPLSQHSNTSFEKDLLLTTHCLSIVILQKSFISGHKFLLKNTRSRVTPGLARTCPGQRRPGAGIQGIPPHVPMSQSATRPLGRQLAYQIGAQTLAGSHHIACKLHAITKDYHPPGRHQNRISRVLQPFRAKTSIFMKKATFTSGAAVVRHLGSLLLGVFWIA